MSIKTPEQAEKEYNQSVQRVADATLAFVAEREGRAPLSDVLAYLQSIERRDDIISRAVSSLLVTKRTDIGVDRFVLTTPEASHE